jgi:hypothetical protein
MMLSARRSTEHPADRKVAVVLLRSKMSHSELVPLPLRAYSGHIFCLSTDRLFTSTVCGLVESNLRSRKP